MKKRKLSIVLVAAMLLQLIPFPADLGVGMGSFVQVSKAAEAPLSGTEGTISWSLSDDGKGGYTLSLTGSGEMKSYSLKDYDERPQYTDYRTDAPWGYYADQIHSVSIGEGITNVSSYAFYRCTGITSVSTPSTVTEIGAYAFYSCYGMKNITLLASIKKIKEYSFFGCNLAEIALPDGLQSIGNNAFQTAFADAGVDTVRIPDTVTSIGSSAFAGATIKSITIPASVKTIASGTFQGCKKLTKAVVSEGITSIGESAFSGDGFLSELTLPVSSLTSIQAAAFSGTALKSFTIPASVTTVGVNPFQGALETISVAEGNSKYEAVNNMLVERAGTDLNKIISYPRDGGETAVLPDGVKIIGKNAFASSNVKSVKVSGSVETIEDSAFSEAKVETIDLPGSLLTIGNSAFYKANRLKAIDIPGRVKQIGNSCFYSCSALEDVILGGDLESLGASAFYNCGKITELVLPDKLTSIGNNAFSYCTGLQELTFPNSITNIGSGVLANCTSLKKVSFGEKIQTIAGNVFVNCPKLAEITISPGNEAMVAEDNVVYDKEKNTLIYFAAGIRDDKFSVPDTVKTIGAYAFTYCQHMKELRIPQSVTLMEERSVYHNDSITKLLFYGNAPEARETGSYQWDYSTYPYQKIGYSASNTSVCENKVKTSYNNDGLTIHYVSDSTGWDSGWTQTKQYKAELDQWGNKFEWKQNCIFVEWDPAKVDVASGDFGNGLAWSYRDDIGELVFTGEGVVPDYTDTLPTWSNDSSVDHMKDIKLIETGGAARIGNNAFRGASHLVRILGENKLKEVGDSTFAECTDLKIVHIPSTEVIGQKAFMNDTALRNDLDLRGAKTMGDQAFKNCSSMTELLLGEHLKTLGSELFFGCSSLEVMMLPESTESLGAGCFSGCSALRTINIPKGIKAVPESCFAGASGLKKVYFYGDYPTWQENSFEGTHEDIVIYYRAGNTTWEAAGSDWNGIPVVGLDKFYTEQEDHYSFSNSGGSFGYGSLYYIPRQRYVTALQSVVRGSYYYQWACGWRGSCFGMAASTTEFYDGDNFSVQDYDASAENLFDLSAPGSPEADLTKIIEIYQVSQYVDEIGGEVAQNYGEYRKLIRQVEEFERSGGLGIDSEADPLVMCIYANCTGHAVVPVAVNMDDEGNYILDVYDCNYPNGFQKLTIKKDFSGIKYDKYKAASFVKYSTIRDALVDADFTGKNLRKSKEESNKVSIAVNRQDVNLENGGGKDYSEIKGAYEQKPMSDGTEDEFSGIRSFVLPQGEYQIQEDSVSRDGEDAAEEDLEYYVATEDLFSKVETTDKDAKLTVKSVKGTGYDSVTLSSEETDTESELTVMSVDGLQKEISVKGSSITAEIVDNKEMTLEVSEDTTELKVDGKEVALSEDHTADISFMASEDENPLTMSEITCDLALNEKNQLSGTVEGLASWARENAGDVDITTVVKDDQGTVIAEYEKKKELSLGMQKVNISMDRVRTNLGDITGEIEATCEVTMTDSSDNTVKVSQSGIVLSAKDLNPEPIPTQAPISTLKPNKPTQTPRPTPTVKPTPTSPSKPNQTSESKPTQTPESMATSKPTQTPESISEPTLMPIPTWNPIPESTSAAKPTPTLKPTQKPAEKPTLEPEPKSTSKPTSKPAAKSTSTPKPGSKSTSTPVPTSNSQNKSPNASKSTQTPDSNQALPEEGEKVESGSLKYTIVKSDQSKGEVAVSGSKNKKATKIKIPKTIRVDGYTFKVTSVGNNAFGNMKQLKKVTLGANIKAIGNNAFKNCTSLKSILVPKKVTTISKKAFAGCKKLKSIVVQSEKLKTVGAGAFKGTNIGIKVKVPKKKYAAYKRMFVKKGKLSSGTKVVAGSE